MVVVALSVPSAVGGGIASIVSLATRGEIHQQTLEAFNASQCITQKCESPAEVALISQLVGRLSTAVAKQQVGEVALLCASLTTNAAANPTTKATNALGRYCQNSTVSNH